MNSWGRLFRVSILGESHGDCVGVLVDGCPAGLSLSEADFAGELARRRPGERGTTRRREGDVPRLLSGVHRGKTTGAPLLILFGNEDIDAAPYSALRHRPRPGHGDLVMLQKFGGFADGRGGGTTSARLTVAMVAAGVVARRVLPRVRFSSRVMEAGGRTDIEAAVAEAERAGDSLGGIVECQVKGLPAGLGEPFFDSVEAAVAHLAFSIPGVKGIEFGAGFAGARLPGSGFADEILDRAGKTRTNNAGGINAGITNGNALVFRVAVRAPSSSALVLKTIDLRTGRSVKMAPRGRHDRCTALRLPVILEAAAAIVLADLMLLEQKVPRVAGGRRKSAR
jgi:chorismate synthase